MPLKIQASSLLRRHYLLVDDRGVKFFDGTQFMGAKRYAFSQIDCVLMSPDHKLTVQSGTDVCTIATNPKNAKHQAVIQALVENLQRAAAAQMSQ